MNNPFYIAIDFDGTVVENVPNGMGKSIGAESWLRRIQKEHPNVRFILWTCRSDEELAKAVKWFEDRDIELYAVNDNPGQRDWSSSPKVYGMYIDDKALGCPLTKSLFQDRYYVDWNKVGPEILKTLNYRKRIK